MSKQFSRVLGGTLLALGMAALVLLTVRAAGTDTTDSVWTTDSFFDFTQGTMDSVDVWSERGAAQLDWAWWSNQRVNALSANSKLSPRLSFALTNTMVSTETVFLAVWADERDSDHCPDLYFDRSMNGGHTWSTDIRIMDNCDPDNAPYPNCPCMYNPDITVRAADENLWVVWWQDWSDTGDNGDIYYTTGSNKGSNWSLSSVAVYTGTGKQLWPRIVSHASSGYLYAAWEDERDDDGDIYIARYNPDTDPAWSTPIKASDDISSAQQSKPSLTVDVDGNLFLMWEDYRDDPDGYDEQIYFSRWFSGTMSWGTWDTSTRLSDSEAHFAGDPYIIAGPGGALYATWWDRIPIDVGGGYTFRIIVARSVDQGDNWSHSVVAQLPAAYESGLSSFGTPAIGIDGSGQLYVAWSWLLDSTSGNSRVLFAQSPDGGVHWTEYRTLTAAPNVQLADAVDLIPSFDGEVVVAWEQYLGANPHIYATGYPADRYLGIGEYKRTFDAGGPAAWDTITWTATLTPGTGLALATRVMTTAGAGWTDWVTHTASGESLTHPSARFLQYRAVFTSSAGSDTSVLDAVGITYEQSRIYLPLVLRSS